MVGSVGYRTPRVMHGGRAVVTGLRVERPGTWTPTVAPAAAALGLGLLGHHVAAGGGTSAVVLLAVPVLLVMCRLSASREIGRGLMLVLVLLGQAAVHMLASSPQHSFGVSIATRASGHAGHAGHTGAPVDDASAGMTDPAMGSIAMVAFHVLAGLVAATLLRWHEARRWAAARATALRRLIAALMGRVLLALPLPEDVPVLAVVTTVPSFTDTLWALLPARRGPPRLHAC